MTGQDIQKVLDDIVLDLQTKGKGKGVTAYLRESDNTGNQIYLSSDANGVVDATQLSVAQSIVNALKAKADAYSTTYQPVKSALDAYNSARDVHKTLIDAASVARKAASEALENDATFQAAKTALESARSDPDYQAAKFDYETCNVSENFGNLRDAKGKYE